MFHRLRPSPSKNVSCADKVYSPDGWLIHRGGCLPMNITPSCRDNWNWWSWMNGVVKAVYQITRKIWGSFRVYTILYLQSNTYALPESWTFCNHFSVEISFIWKHFPSKWFQKSYCLSRREIKFSHSYLWENKCTVSVLGYFLHLPPQPHPTPSPTHTSRTSITITADSLCKLK